MQNHVDFAGNVGQLGIQSLGVLRLINGDWGRDPKLLGHLLRRSIQGRLGVALNPVHRFEQLKTHVFRILGAPPLTGEPGPHIGIARFEKITDCSVIGQRLKSERHRRSVAGAKWIGECSK